MQTKQDSNMSPIEVIINMLDNYAKAELTKVDINDPDKNNIRYQAGKAAGLWEAADHIRNLQKLFS
jgi:hypothetical protein